MKLIKPVLIVLAAIVVLLTVIGFLLPARTQVERSVEINAQPETVFRLLNDLRVFNQWSPWAKIDPQTEYSYSGSETGVGSVMRWSSGHPHVGKGEQKIVSSEPDSEIRLILTMEGMKPFQAGYILEPVDSEGTRLTWTYEADNGWNLFYRYLGVLAMDRMLGSMFEQGLADFKEIAESQPQPAPTQITSQVIPYEVDGVIHTGYLAYDPAADNSPGVLVVHEWWGHNDYARKRADMLAQLGYTAFALDMYGDGRLAEHPDDAMKFAQQTMGDPEAVVAKFEAALQVLKEHGRTDPEKIAAIGYCLGGGIVLNMARAGIDLDVVVSFHGSLNAILPMAQDVRARVLVLNGADDPFVTAEQIDAFKKEMDTAGIRYEFIDYPGAVHAFTNPEADELGQKFNMPLAYNAEADQASWQKMQEWFKSVFEN